MVESDGPQSEAETVERRPTGLVEVSFQIDGDVLARAMVRLDEVLGGWDKTDEEEEDLRALLEALSESDRFEVEEVHAAQSPSQEEEGRKSPAPAPDMGPLIAAIEALLADPATRLLPLVLNPLAFPGEEEWAFYDATVRPLLEKHGWTLADEHVPIACDEHWEIDMELINDRVCADSPLDSVKGAMAIMRPRSDEARRCAAWMANDRIEWATCLVLRVIEEAGRAGRVPLNVDIPGLGLSRYEASDEFGAVLRAERGDPRS